jgi:hypothetical protein
MAHYRDPSSYDWFWMMPMMLLWILVFGAVVYAAVRVALHDKRVTRRR